MMETNGTYFQDYDNYYHYVYNYHNYSIPKWEDIDDFEARHVANNHHQFAALITFLSLLFILSLSVNIVLLIQQYRNTLNRGAVRFMLINLAIVNILCTIFSILFLAVSIGVSHWYAGDFMCKLMMFLGGFELFLRPFSSLGLMMAYITEQATHRSGKTIALFFIIPAWVCGVMLCIPRIPIHVVMYEPPICLATYTDWGQAILGLHLLSVVVLGYLFPTLITIILCCVYSAVGKSNRDTTKVAYNPSTAETTKNETETISNNDVESVTTDIYPPECPNDEIDLTPPTTTTKPPHLRLSSNNIQPRSYLPLVICTIIVVLDTPSVIVGALSILIQFLWGIVLWFYAIRLTSIFITGMIAVIWHVRQKRNSQAGFSFQRFI